jgi:all-trans-8'-apo-beta-carotenal 15,15'-oxygenase
MWKKSVKPKSTAFKKCQLKTVKGELPNKFQGRLFRNGPGVLARGNQLVSHWFLGNGALLQLEFYDKKCHAQYSHIPTPRYLEEEKANSIPRFNPFGMLKKIVTGNQRLDETNPANTSVLPLPHSNVVYALCEGGSPFRFTKGTL